ncbi:helix-turn-helix domain-containing protein [Streptomyces sp. NPDC051561]|uniref:helix-turn-helix domain-containing protein n=1 Tax=Streptomyces sp. NPDC051561 TaxID=3365658 RepID=UPI0037882731
MKDQTQSTEGAPQSLAEAIGSAEQVVGRRVKSLRVTRGWSQQELATRMATKGYQWRQTTVAKTEAADRPIRVNEVQGLASIFGVTVSDLMTVPIDDFEMATATIRLNELRGLLDASNQRVLELQRTRQHIDRELEEASRAHSDLIDQVDAQVRECTEIADRLRDSQGE